MKSQLASLASGLLLGACSVVGVRSGTEEPAFTVVGHAGAAEIRRYEPRIAAETTIEATGDDAGKDGGEVAARGEGFRRLAGYIFGGNTTKAKIAMTAPVAQASDSGGTTIAMTAPVAQDRQAGGWTIRFFMPAGSTLETLPTPLHPAVHLVAVGAETFAVLRFTGSTGPEAVAEQSALLTRSLAGSTWTSVGGPVAWFYDPPWTLPFLRRNEVAVRVKSGS